MRAILLRSIDQIAPDFHALTSAQSRTYDYLFTFDSRLPHYLAPSVTLLFNEPNFIPSAEEINRCFTGLRNWSSLSNISDVPSVIRRVSDVSLTVESYPSLFGDTIDIYRFKNYCRWLSLSNGSTYCWYTLAFYAEFY